MLEKIMTVLTERRMMSIINLASAFDLEPEAIKDQLAELEAAGRIRYAQSRCKGSCSTCSSCPSGEREPEKPAAPDFDPTAIVISLDKKPEED
jgi:predicted metal-binding protein